MGLTIIVIKGDRGAHQVVPRDGRALEGKSEGGIEELGGLDGKDEEPCLESAGGSSG